MTTKTDTVTVSQNCAAGKHHRCLGSVAVVKPVNGRTLVPCGCTERGCTHGPAKSKAEPVDPAAPGYRRPTTLAGNPR